jgi:hypothetical protein
LCSLCGDRDEQNLLEREDCRRFGEKLLPSIAGHLADNGGSRFFRHADDIVLQYT